MVNVEFESAYELILVALGIIAVAVYYIKYGEAPSSRMTAYQNMASDVFEKLNAFALMWRNPKESKPPGPEYIRRIIRQILEEYNLLDEDKKKKWNDTGGA